MTVFSEEKQRSERSQRFPFNGSEVKLHSVVTEVKQHSEHSQIFHFNNSEVKQRSERSKRVA